MQICFRKAKAQKHFIYKDIYTLYSDINFSIYTNNTICLKLFKLNLFLEIRNFLFNSFTFIYILVRL